MKVLKMDRGVQVYTQRHKSTLKGCIISLPCIFPPGWTSYRPIATQTGFRQPCRLIFPWTEPGPPQCPLLLLHVAVCAGAAPTVLHGGVARSRRRGHMSSTLRFPNLWEIHSSSAWGHRHLGSGVRVRLWETFWHFIKRVEETVSVTLWSPLGNGWDLIDLSLYVHADPEFTTLRGLA